jgi:hypothetical protein
MPASIFVSHASRDRTVAQSVCKALENRGLHCWISSRDIRPGENFQVAIVAAIRSAKVMILIFSANSKNSEEIKKELALAGQNRLPVIPVRVEDVTPEEAFAYELATHQWIDLFDDWEEAIHRLAEQLAAVDEVGPAPERAQPVAEPTPPPAIAPSDRHSRVRRLFDKLLGRDSPARAGVRGWLLVICIFLIILNPLAIASACSLVLQNLTAYWFRIGHLTPFMITTFINVVIYVAIGGYGVYAGYGLWMIKKNAVARAKRYFMSFLLFPLLTDIMFISGAPELPTLKGTAENYMGETLWTLFYIVIFILIMFLYFERSKRVANTYR